MGLAKLNKMDEGYVFPNNKVSTLNQFPNQIKLGSEQKQQLL